MPDLKKSQVSPLLNDLATSFAEDLKHVGGTRFAIKPKVREDMIAGFRDGARSMLLRLQAEGYLTVTDDTASPAPAAKVG